MNPADKKALIARNAGSWAVAALLSFVLPLVTDSLTDGRSEFLRMLMHLMPLFAALMITNMWLGKAIPEAKAVDAPPA